MRRSATLLTLVLVALSFALTMPEPAHAGLLTVGVAVNDSYAVRHDRTLSVDAPGVLSNDLNVDLLGGTTINRVADVSHGTLTLDSNGGFTYAPDARYVGTDNFSYRLAGLLTTPATVTITVTNNAPVAHPDAYSGPARTTLSIPAPGVLGNDTDADGDALTATVVDDGGISGSINLASNGALVYSPGGGFSGTATLTYRVSDGIITSNTTTVSLTIQAAAPTSTASPSPRPTPKPTPAPTPRPTATATPRPLPMPLPSLPLPTPPLPSIGIIPTEAAAPTSEVGTSTAPGSGGQPLPTTDASPSAATPSDGVGGSGDGNAGGGSGSASSGGASQARANSVSIGQNGLGVVGGGSGGGDEVSVSLLGGLDIAPLWFVPAAVVGGPGLLVILWIALQLGAGLAWLPAARRFRRAGPQAGWTVVSTSRNG